MRSLGFLIRQPRNAFFSAVPYRARQACASGLVWSRSKTADCWLPQSIWPPIQGRVFDDFSGNGFDAGEEVANATLVLYRDDGDGLFEPGAGDVVERTTMTDSNGLYEFERLTAGSYFVFQPAQPGLDLQSDVSPLITIGAEDVKGTITTTIDTFDLTTQLVRDEINDGVPVTSSVPAPDAIGNERDLLVNKTSTNGAVQLSVDDPLLPNQLTFDSIATGAGDRRITWDGIDGDATTVDDTGLANVDLAANAVGVQLQIRADLAVTTRSSACTAMTASSARPLDSARRRCRSPRRLERFFRLSSSRSRTSWRPPVAASI